MNLKNSFQLAELFISKLAKDNHFIYNKSAVNNLLKDYNDPEIIKSSKLLYKGYYKYSFQLISISEIEVEHIWNKDKLDNVLKYIKDNKPLDPVILHKVGLKYIIEDGIHRINASIENNFQYVPAIIKEWIDI